MESPFIHRFGTNYTPSDDEVEQLRRLLLKPMIQENDLTTEISELEARRNQLDDFITPYLALLSPIRRVPQQILRKIFVQCLRTDHNPIMSGREAPLLLGRVCSSWRSISRTTPKLWSSIHISSPESYGGKAKPEDEASFTEAIVDWLNRSGDLPLSVSVRRGFQETHSDNLIPRLISFSNRWRSLDLYLHPNEFPPFAALSTDDVPLLKSFSIELYKDHNHYDSGSTELYMCGIFQAPCLQQLLISSSLVSFDALISWSQLTELIITQLALTEGHLRTGVALAILKRCENLVSCTIEFPTSDAFSMGAFPALGTLFMMGAFPQPQSDIPNVMVTLPLLKTLTIRWGTNSHGPFFDHLHLPMLDDFTFHVNYNDHGTFDCPSFYTFLGRLTTLDRFTLHAHSLRRETLASCITQVPCITKLHLSLYNIGSTSPYPADDHILGLLTPTATHTPLCPSIKIIKCDPSAVSDAALLSFIQSRTIFSSAYHVAHLDRAEFKLPREEKEGIFLVPSEVVSGGTEVVVTYHVPIVFAKERPLHPWSGVHYIKQLSCWSAIPWI